MGPKDNLPFTKNSGAKVRLETLAVRLKWQNVGGGKKIKIGEVCGACHLVDALCYSKCFLKMAYWAGLSS